MPKTNRLGLTGLDPCIGCGVSIFDCDSSRREGRLGCCPDCDHAVPDTVDDDAPGVPTLDVMLSPHFAAREFVCRCGYCMAPPGVVSPRLIMALEELRARLDAPLIIVSGYRCVDHNREVGGAPRSQHTLGMAADVRSDGSVSIDRIAREARLVKALCYGGIGIYRDWVHLDVRQSGPARWFGSLYLSRESRSQVED